MDRVCTFVYKGKPLVKPGETAVWCGQLLYRGSETAASLLPRVQAGNVGDAHI